MGANTMITNCENCNAAPPRISSGQWAGQSHLHQYCIHCSENLCEKCLASKRCRESPTGKHEVEGDE